LYNAFTVQGGKYFVSGIKLPFLTIRSATRENAPPESEHSMARPSETALPLEPDLIGYQAEPCTTVQDPGLPILDMKTLPLFGPSTFQQLVSTMVSRRDLGVTPTPGRFTIDPLHFLGITPTTQSSELLQACKLIHYGMRY
jgi:hypothetical protein